MTFEIHVCGHHCFFSKNCFRYYIYVCSVCLYEQDHLSLCCYYYNIQYVLSNYSSSKGIQTYKVSYLSDKCINALLRFSLGHFSISFVHFDSFIYAQFNISFAHFFHTSLKCILRENGLAIIYNGVSHR